uniref:Uncharacterized protein LOC105052703 n=1 Tax=Elaeis guineensis var. tenera TaxID=51953 RepID=A0A6I9RT29_ELAGV|nr:uncharacterized protein LOC105052703 [Elaeis guineensis]
MMKCNRRCFKKCGLVTSIVIVLLIVTLVILYFTMFKPKDPEVETTLVNIRNIEFGLFPTPTLNLSLALDIFINNRNYAAFKNDNTTTNIYYRGVLVGLSPIEAGTVRPRGTKNISCVAKIQVEKIISNPYFLPDIASGPLNLTSSTNMDGKAMVLKIFKLRASIHVACNISVFVFSGNSSSICESKIRM